MQYTLGEKDKQNIYEELMTLKYPADRSSPHHIGESAGDEDGLGGPDEID